MKKLKDLLYKKCVEIHSILSKDDRSIMLAEEYREMAQDIAHGYILGIAIPNVESEEVPCLATQYEISKYIENKYYPDGGFEDE